MAQLAVALRKIFDKNPWWRNGSVGSWQGAFQANVYARLGDGDMALAVLNTHLARSVNSNMTAHFNSGGAEFEIDGNLGLTAAVGEMLLQSHAGEIELLPALPKDWSAGKVTGLRARGGFEVDLSWQEGRLVKATVRQTAPAVGAVLRYGPKTIELDPRERVNGCWTFDF